MPPTSSDPIVDSSPKVSRANNNNGQMSPSGYESQHDSNDDLFEEYETVPTLPLSRPHISYNDLKAQISSPSSNATQPARIIRDTASHIPRRPNASVVQVAASSPPPVSSPAPAPQPRRPMISMMAPPGTAFRPPPSLPTQPIDISDDDLPVEHSSSEDELSRSRSNIKPSTFATGGRSQATSSWGASKGSAAQFKDLTSRYTYDSPSSLPQKRPAVDDMASAYGSRRDRPQKQIRQTGPSRAQPVTVDLTIDEIPDFELKNKVRRMTAVYPNKSIRTLLEALFHKKGNYDDALDYVMEQEERQNAVDLTLSDDEKEPAKPVKPSPVVPTAKRQVKAPNRTIQQKWSSTQAVTKNVSQDSSPPSTPPKPRRRLVQGRRAPSSPAAPLPQVLPERPKPIEIDSDTASDSGVASDDESDVGAELEDRVLKFFNTCSVQDLADTSNSSEEVAGAILAKRPFKTLGQVRAITIDNDPPNKGKASKRKSTKRPIGDRIVDVCIEMQSGYEAVDELVRRCEALGKPIAAEMKKWGIDVYGASKDGELGIVSLDETKSDTSSVRDSGIGTPLSSSPAPEDTDADVRITPKRAKTSFLKQPAIMSKDLVMKDYQIVGLNWLNLLWSKKLSCILADDMGLGKTCQVIAFLSHLYEIGERGPHLVVVPGSTLENCLREFRNFSPVLNVEPFYGSQAERAEQRVRLKATMKNINVIVTTYETAVKQKEDNKFLRDVVRPVVCVYDEGHTLKNSNSNRHMQLMRIPAQFRLLMTGTPLQNNLQELASLLAFIMPDLFYERQEDLAYVFKHKAKTTDANHATLLSAQRIARARSMMTPFILRRKKHQVLKHLPAKTRRVEYCDPTPHQKQLYDQVLEEQKGIMAARAAGEKIHDSANYLQILRNAAIHPLLFLQKYDETTIAKMARAAMRDPELVSFLAKRRIKKDEQTVREQLETNYTSDISLHKLCHKFPDTLGSFALHNQEWMDSGKVQALCELLKRFTAAGDRTLVFSQFTSVMDILEDVLISHDISFFRLDGSTPIDQRQDMLDEFYADPSISVFMLSTKAGGAGINLACANKVVIFDSSFNPQDDIQAENRAHRVGQSREVEVVRLVTRGTIEEQIHALGESKLKLDERVAGEGEEDGVGEMREKEGMNLVERMLLQGQREEGEGEKSEARDVKTAYLDGLKAAGLDMSAAS